MNKYEATRVALRELIAAVKEWRLAEIAVDNYFDQEGDYDDGMAEDLEQAFEDAETTLREMADVLISEGVVTK